MFLYYGLIVIVIFATVAMMVQHGIWNNLVSLISIVFAAVIAYGVHQPIVVFADEQTDGSYTYLLDFPIIWSCFALAVLLIQAIANALSKNRVNFPDAIEKPASALIGLVAGCLLASFTMSTFHAAPLAKDPFGSGGGYDLGVTAAGVRERFREPAVITKPEVFWLVVSWNFLRSNSYGADGFDPAIFVSQHAQHRSAFEGMDDTIVRRK